jgi:hypothetical protein
MEKRIFVAVLISIGFLWLCPRHAPDSPHPSSGGAGEWLFGDDVGHG